MDQQRRDFLKQTGFLTAASVMMPVINAIAMGKGSQKKPKILLRSSWQVVNIGDISHSFGLIELFNIYLPEAEIILWPVSVDVEVDALMRRSFPKLNIIQGRLDDSGKPATTDLQKAFAECDLMVHGSGPYVAAYKDVRAWWNNTKKPFGVYGVSLDEVDEPLKELIDHASFFFCRDSESLKYLRSLNLKCPIQQLGLDATFALKLQNEQKAEAYLTANGLKRGKFICVIPRLRYTPYWQMRGVEPTVEEKRKYAISLQHKEIDAAKLREVMIKWVKDTGLKVLACAEVTQQVALSKEVLVDPLPDEIKKNVVWRDSFWLPDEARSIYAKARVLISYEMHSPIIAFTEKVPAIYLKQPTDTRKGQMWRDIGLNDWIFEIDETPASQIANMVSHIHSNYTDAQKQIGIASTLVNKIQRETMHEAIQTIK
ncbi:MAG: polysaccharide pyruvyl transferase family protein [Mucilaginibacter sp.]|uniref:polysaccharide pyruvyl transferase family protein n=1 Tax=Mucilaginibacter sp. TaxID=1882438 RepID=UPI0032679B2D